MSAVDFKRITVHDDELNRVANKIIDLYQETGDINNNNDNSYEFSYQYLCEYAKTVKNQGFPEQGLVVLAHAVYGWMPTILFLQPYPYDQGIQNGDLVRIQGILRRKNPDLLDDPKSLCIIASFTNKSFVGASKFLHFLFPDQFAIWDSNINAALHEIRNTANNVNAFILYQKAIRSARDLLNEPRPSMRDIELKLFNIGREHGYHNDI